LNVKIQRFSQKNKLISHFCSNIFCNLYFYKKVMIFSINYNMKTEKCLQLRFFYIIKYNKLYFCFANFSVKKSPRKKNFAATTQTK
jgi:hypothetical protein